MMTWHPVSPPLAHRIGTRLIRLGVLLHGYGTLLLVRRTRPARVTMTPRATPITFTCRDCTMALAWDATTTLSTALGTGCPLCSGTNWKLTLHEGVAA